MAPLGLSAAEMDDLVDFLEALTDPRYRDLATVEVAKQRLRSMSLGLD